MSDMMSTLTHRNNNTSDLEAPADTNVDDTDAAADTLSADATPETDDAASSSSSNNSKTPNSKSENKIDNAMPVAAVRKLSSFSKKYDVNGDGVLDEAELAMRDMDKTGRGYLTNDKVYKLMQEQLATQKELFRFKKVVIGLAVLVVILTLSNLGTSFAAAYLAKDTTTSADEELINVNSKAVVSTQTTTESFNMQRVTTDSSGRRRLCSSADGNLYQCETDSYVEMDEDEAEKLFKLCRNGRRVDLIREWGGRNRATTTEICPQLKGDYNLVNLVVALKDPTGGEVTFTKKCPGQGKCYYVLDGDAVTQNEGDICIVTADCDSDLVCGLRPDSDVASCKSRCERLRFGPQMLQPCKDDCDHKICK